MRVGRSPLDADAVRQIEAAYPDIEFDWREILKGRQDPVPERPRAEPGSRGDRPPRAPDKPERRERTSRGARPAERAVSAPPPAPLASGSQRPSPDPVDASVDATGPAHARLGGAGLARLRARFADLTARIRDRIDDEERRQQLNASAERLNPDGWRTDEEVSAGLESYEATFEAVKIAIGGRGPAGPDPAGSE